MPPRVCRRCEQSLPPADFYLGGSSGYSRFCVSCRDELRQLRDWQPHEIERLRRAGSGVVGVWMRHLHLVTEEDRVAIRELIGALDRQSVR